MSYILDALKKAERERHLTRVPTLTTVHSSVRGTGRRMALWAVAPVLLVGAGLSIWLLRPTPSVAPPVATDFRTDLGATRPASPVAPGGTTTPLPPAATQPAAPVTPAPPGPSVENQSNAPRQPTREPAVSPRPTVIPPRQAAGPSGLPSDGGAARSVEPEPVRRTPDSSAAVSRPAEPPPPPQVPPSAGADRPRADTVVTPPPSLPPNPPMLHDAIGKMKLDILVYTDVPADRMVIIGGQKYVVGQLVDGLYLLEGITREGAILSYQGERAVLQP